MPLRQSPRSIRRSRDGHVSVTFGSQTSNIATYANTGMDLFARGATSVAFYDVADGDALLAILNRPQDA